MLLRVPTSIDDPVLEGVLEPADEPGGVLRGPPGRPDSESIGRTLPVVSIGQPTSWPLADLWQGELPAMLAATTDREFRLVRLACSFRPRPGGEGIDWARFAVQLLPDKDGNQPIAFDLHPLEQVHQVKRNLTVGLSPSLKFEEVEGSLGSVESGIEYAELQPTISGSGIGETTPCWDFEAARGVRVVGTRCVHLITSAPRGMAAARAALDLTADVVGAGFRIPVILPRRRTEGGRLQVRLWSEGRG